MKNNILDLNNHLFAQLEMLSDPSLKGAELISELDRAKGISGLSMNIIANNKLAYDIAKFTHETSNVQLPENIECRKYTQKK